MKHLVIPDVQAKPGHDFSFLTRVGKYIVDKQPEKVICLGDFADMPSLSSYDQGKKSFEGKRYVKDIESAKEAMSYLMQPLVDNLARLRRNKEKLYWPELHLLYGNHEHRIDRAVDSDPKLDGVLSVSDLGYETHGWTVYPFLDVLVLDGVAYSHYFTSGVMGRPATTASAQLAKKHQSCIAGHQQGFQMATAYRADGRRLTSIIAGSCYEHDEDYMGPQGNNHWRGCLMLHSVDEGEFDLVPVPLTYLKTKYD